MVRSPPVFIPYALVPGFNLSAVAGVHRCFTGLCDMVITLNSSVNPWLSLPSSQLRLEPNCVVFGDRELEIEPLRRARPPSAAARYRPDATSHLSAATYRLQTTVAIRSGINDPDHIRVYPFDRSTMDPWTRSTARSTIVPAVRSWSEGPDTPAPRVKSAAYQSTQGCHCHFA
jgi:hypothetical protein